MNKEHTKIVVVLDESGSMSTIRKDTIGGFNTFIQDQRKVPGTADVTVISFNSRPKTVHDSVPLTSSSLELNDSNYRPSGNTALLDAIGLAITSVGEKLSALPESDRPGKVIVVILTDGEENASTDYRRSQINEMITHQREKYSWDFVFLGANQDAFHEAGKLGISQGSTMSYAASAQGMTTNYVNLSKSISRSRVGGLSVSFTDAERKAAEELLKGRT